MKLLTFQDLFIGTHRIDDSETNNDVFSFITYWFWKNDFLFWTIVFLEKIKMIYRQTGKFKESLSVKGSYFVCYILL